MKVSLDFDEVQGDCIPSDEEMFEQWRARVEGLAKALRLLEPEAEAQDVLSDFILNGYHRRWDRTKGRQFNSFCFWMLRNRLLSRLRAQKRRLAREGEPVDVLTLEMAYEPTGFEAVEQRQDLRSLAGFIEAVHQQSSGVTPADVLRAMVSAEEDAGEVDVCVLAADLGVSTTTLRHHRAVLRNLLSDMDEASFLTELISS